MKTALIEIKNESILFNDEGEFLDQLRKVESETEWREDVNSDLIELSPVEGANPFPEFGGDQFDTVQISFDHGWTHIPLRNTCLTSLLQRAEISGAAIKKLFVANPSCFTEHLNSYFELKDEKRKTMKALIQEGRLSALHSGGYAIIPMTEIFETTHDRMAESLEHTEFVSGSWSYEIATALYRVNDERLVNVYSQLLGKYFQFNEVSITLRATSSDVAENAVRFSPRFEVDGVTIPLSGDASVRHYGEEATIGKVAEKLDNVFTSFKASCRFIAALENIVIKNTKNAMIKAFSKLAIPQKYAADVVEHYDNYTSNALVVYTGMCRVLNNMKAAGMSPAELVNCEDLLAKVITFSAAQWNHFDIPGEVAWNAKSK